MPFLSPSHTVYIQCCKSGCSYYTMNMKSVCEGRPIGRKKAKREGKKPRKSNKSNSIYLFIQCQITTIVALRQASRL